MKNICRIFSSVYPEQSLVMAHLTFTLCPPIAGLGESRSPDGADFKPVCKTLNEKDISRQRQRKIIQFSSIHSCSLGISNKFHIPSTVKYYNFNSHLSSTLVPLLHSPELILLQLFFLLPPLSVSVLS